jgi:hypothetical protein
MWGRGQNSRDHTFREAEPKMSTVASRFRQSISSADHQGEEYSRERAEVRATLPSTHSDRFSSLNDFASAADTPRRRYRDGIDLVGSQVNHTGDVMSGQRPALALSNQQNRHSPPKYLTRSLTSDVQRGISVMQEIYEVSTFSHPQLLR